MWKRTNLSEWNALSAFLNRLRMFLLINFDKTKLISRKILSQSPVLIAQYVVLALIKSGWMPECISKEDGNMEKVMGLLGIIQCLCKTWGMEPGQPSKRHGKGIWVLHWMMRSGTESVGILKLCHAMWGCASFSFSVFVLMLWVCFVKWKMKKLLITKKK